MKYKNFSNAIRESLDSPRLRTDANYTHIHHPRSLLFLLVTTVSKSLRNKQIEADSDIIYILGKD